MTVSIDDIARQMLVLLPEDGTPVSNKDMRVLLTRTLAEWVDEDRYLSAREKLISSRLIELKRGPGGQIYRSTDAAQKKLTTKPSGKWSESELMPWLGKYLRGPFRSASNNLKGAECLAYDTSASGPTGIRWARPDYTLISVRRFKFLTGAEIDIHSFELKAESGVDDLAIFEALAQTRFTHFGYLVWHLPKQSKSEKRLADIQRQCGQRGIGFIRIFEPEKLENWEIIAEPVRQSTPPAEIDQFLHERLSGHRQDVIKLVNGAQP